jgi:hypothetical protein
MNEAAPQADRKILELNKLGDPLTCLSRRVLLTKTKSGMRQTSTSLAVDKA